MIPTIATSMAGVLFDNFLGFDFIIFLVAAVNVFVLCKTTFYSKQLYSVLNPYCWIPGGEASLKEIQEKFAKRSGLDSESDIILLRRKTSAYYVVYENLTAIFPLMGLLGTVVSLLPMVEDMGEIATGLFFSALTSTMWGIIFAIVFKAFNGYLYARIEDNEKNIEVFLQRNTNRLRSKPAEEKAKKQPKKETIAEEPTESEELAEPEVMPAEPEEIAATPEETSTEPEKIPTEPERG